MNTQPTKTISTEALILAAVAVALVVITFLIPETRQRLDVTLVFLWQGLEHAIVAVATWITNLF